MVGVLGSEWGVRDSVQEMLCIGREGGMVWNDEVTMLQHGCGEVRCMERGAVQISEHDI